MKHKITATCTGRYLKIFINGLLHVSVTLYDFYGIQATVESNNWFTIKIYSKKNILLEYDNKELWSEILKLINENVR